VKSNVDLEMSCFCSVIRVTGFSPSRPGFYELLWQQMHTASISRKVHKVTQSGGVSEVV